MKFVMREELEDGKLLLCRTGNGPGMCSNVFTKIAVRQYV
jgi:hypothetical protein